MRSIPILVKTIECKQFRGIYLKNKTFFINFFLHFSNMHWNTGSIVMRAPLSYWLMISKVIEFQKSLFVTWNILTLFVNTLTADDKYSLISRDNWMQTIQMDLSQKQNHFSQFFSAILESAWKFKHFQRKMTLIAYVFPKLRTPKDALR